MTSASFARIKIGGTMKRAALPVLARAIAQDGIDLDPRETAPSVIAAAIEQGISLSFTDERPLGQYQHLERACQELGLSYVRADFGCTGEWSANGVRWAPGMPEPDEFNAASESGDPILLVRDARARLSAGTLEAELDRLESIAAFALPLTIIDN